jgi:cytochrome c5
MNLFAARGCVQAVVQGAVMLLRHRLQGIVSLAVLSLCAAQATAADKTGKEVVEQTCAGCHATGKDGAPKIGDAQAWLSHSKKGLTKLAESAISGIGKMPAQGVSEFLCAGRVNDSEGFRYLDLEI